MYEEPCDVVSELVTGASVDETADGDGMFVLPTAVMGVIPGTDAEGLVELPPEGLEDVRLLAVDVVPSESVMLTLLPAPVVDDELRAVLVGTSEIAIGVPDSSSVATVEYQHRELTKQVY